MSRSRHPGKYYQPANWHWYRSEPRWWRNLAKHRKQRTECRRCRHEVLTGNEDVLWPLDKKPWVYYW